MALQKKREQKRADKEQLILKRLEQLANSDIVRSYPTIVQEMHSTHNLSPADLELVFKFDKKVGSYCIIHQLGLVPWPAQIMRIIPQGGRDHYYCHYVQMQTRSTVSEEDLSPLIFGEALCDERLNFESPNFYYTRAYIYAVNEAIMQSIHLKEIRVPNGDLIPTVAVQNSNQPILQQEIAPAELNEVTVITVSSRDPSEKSDTFDRETAALTPAQRRRKLELKIIAELNSPSIVKEVKRVRGNIQSLVTAMIKDDRTQVGRLYQDIIIEMLLDIFANRELYPACRKKRLPCFVLSKQLSNFKTWMQFAFADIKTCVKGQTMSYEDYIDLQISKLPKNCHFLAPVHLYGNHYVAALILANKKVSGAKASEQIIYIFDSMQSEGKRREVTGGGSYFDNQDISRQIQILDRQTQGFLHKLSQHLWSNKAEPTLITKCFNLPQQDNGFDCGVFTVEFIVRAFYFLKEFLWRVQPVAPGVVLRDPIPRNSQVGQIEQPQFLQVDPMPKGTQVPLYVNKAGSQGRGFNQELISERRIAYRDMFAEFKTNGTNLYASEKVLLRRMTDFLRANFAAGPVQNRVVRFSLPKNAEKGVVQPARTS